MAKKMRNAMLDSCGRLVKLLYIFIFSRFMSLLLPHGGPVTDFS